MKFINANCIYCGATISMEINELEKDNQNIIDYVNEKVRTKANYHCMYFDENTRDYRLKRAMSKKLLFTK